MLDCSNPAQRFQIITQKMLTTLFKCQVRSNKYPEHIPEVRITADGYPGYIPEVTITLLNGYPEYVPEVRMTSDS